MTHIDGQRTVESALLYSPETLGDLIEGGIITAEDMEEQ